MGGVLGAQLTRSKCWLRLSGNYTLLIILLSSQEIGSVE